MRQASGVGLVLAASFFGVALVVAAEPGDKVDETKPAVVAAAERDAGAPDASTTVTISVRSTPTRAVVYWGKARLGVTPLSLERPRGSGPVDLTLRAGGRLPVHVRAYTFENDALTVRMTRRDETHTLFGYRAPIPPDGGVADGGAAPDAGASPPPPVTP